MAEILISLTIIGVIAAITLPSLQANINEKTWATQRKALYSRMSQAIGMMPSLNGYGIGATDAETASKATQAFISEGLSKVLKINNICDGSTVESLEKCGFPKKFTKMGINSKMDTPTTIVGLNKYFNLDQTMNNGNARFVYSQINTNSASFETANGESILTFYNPNCSYNFVSPEGNTFGNLVQPTICANFIFDLNGKKGPNKVGKDIGFMTAFYPTDSNIVMPIPVGHVKVNKDNNHPKFSIGFGNQSCRKFYGSDAKITNIEELISVFVNNKLGYTSSTSPNFITNEPQVSSTASANKFYVLSALGDVYSWNITNYIGNGYLHIFCIKH